MTHAEIAEALGRSRLSVASRVYQKGLAVRVGRGGGSRWRVAA